MRVTLPLLLLLPAACATPQRVTWDDAATVQARAAAQAPTPSTAPARALRGDQVSPGFAVDRALQMFASRRALARDLPRTSTEHAASWIDVLDEIDDACAVKPRATDLGAFVRARVTLEVELDRDVRKRTLLPDDIGKRLTRTLRAVDEEVAELRLIAAPGTMQPSPRLIAGTLVLRAPVGAMLVSSPFGVRTDPIDGYRRFHAGVDIEAPEGTMVYASAPGYVVYAGWSGGYGRHVVIDHGDGVRTHYSHMAALFVRVGQVVDEKEPLGAVGSTGRSTGPHLHWAVTNAGGSFLDPMSVLDVPLSPEIIEPTAPELRPVAMTR